VVGVFVLVNEVDACLVVALGAGVERSLGEDASLRLWAEAAVNLGVGAVVREELSSGFSDLAAVGRIVLAETHALRVGLGVDITAGKGLVASALAIGADTGALRVLVEVSLHLERKIGVVEELEGGTVVGEVVGAEVPN